MPPLTVRTLDGTEVNIGPGADAERQVIFVFNTTCPFCLATLPAWKEIAEAVERDGRVGVYGISLDPVEATAPYATEHELPFPILPVDGARFGSYYRMKVVPLTLVIDSSGYVLHARSQGIESGSAAVDSIIAAARTSLQ